VRFSLGHTLALRFVIVVAVEVPPDGAGSPGLEAWNESEADFLLDNDWGSSLWRHSQGRDGLDSRRNETFSAARLSRTLLQV
jgi:hypothetical protein